MGLDMYVHTTDAVVDADVDFEPEEGSYSRLHYWRKHPNLHGWMEALYRTKGGKSDHFNLSAVKLTEQDIDTLEKTILADALSHCTGFFFGVSRPEDKESDLEFIQKAREALNQGKTLFYVAWW